MGSTRTLSSRLLNDYEDRRREHTRNHRTRVVRTPNRENPRVVNVNIKGRENALDHHCDDFEIVSGSKNTAVIRRGGIFNIEVEMNQDIDLDNKHKMYMILSFGSEPFASKGTQAALKVTGKKTFDREKDFWDSRIVSDSGNKVDIQIRIPSDAPVGMWDLRFNTKNKNSDDYQSFLFKGDIYILFNPWNPDDGVYLEDEEYREEYVMNDVGKLWLSSSPSNVIGREWVFGQFDDVVLPVCAILLGKSGIADEDRGDCVKVSRAISKVVNCQDEGGLLLGSWTGEYSDGTSPTAWTGSIKIMEEYIRRNKTVKYGQCWVFSGVVTTICRALGIPCRSVTNLISAHDTNKSLTIEEYYDESLEKINTGNPDQLSGIGDSIWNFHVWNDVWMARPDLPPGYGGWQAIDATPQEQSYGFNRCGPASLVAIQKGDVHLNYDVDFVMAEVNADIVRFKVDNYNRQVHMSSDKEKVGKQIITEGPGNCGKLDCTAEYKFTEGHKLEREAVLNAKNKNSERCNGGSDPGGKLSSNELVQFELEEVESVLIGQDFSISVKVNNTSSTRKTVSVVMKASSQYYTGEEAGVIRRSKGEFVLEPREKKELALPINFNEYYDKLVEHSIVKMQAMCTVKETSQYWMSYSTTHVSKPRLFMKVLDHPCLGTPFSVLASFKNPLDKNLRNCTLSIDGPGLTKPQILDLDDVDAGEEMECAIELILRTPRKKTLVATFNSKELHDIAGAISFKPRQ